MNLTHDENQMVFEGLTYHAEAKPVPEGCEGCAFRKMDSGKSFCALARAQKRRRCDSVARSDGRSIVWVRPLVEQAPEYDPAEVAFPKDFDPSGLDAHAPGAKLDAGKPHAELALDGFGLALLEVAKVATMGAKKYSPGGWLHVEGGIERYRRAGDRHRLQRGTESHDPESGLLHLAHEAWNRLAELELLLRETR